MNILHVETGRHHFGGAAQVDLLMSDLRRRGVRNILLCSRSAPIAASQSAALVIGKPVAGDVDVRLMAWVRAAIRRYRIDVVHVHSRRGADIWAGMGARLAGVPAIVTRRVDNPEPKWIARLKYALYHRVIVISTAVEATVLAAGVDSSKVVCISDAVDLSVFRPRTPDPALRAEFGVTPGGFCIGMVAQFIERKGHRDLIAALGDVVRVLPDVRVVLCGQGPMQSAIEREIRAAGLTSHVLLAGFRDDMPRVMPVFDVLVHPARREGLGVAVLQAGASGVPVVSTRAGGIVDVIIDGQNGLLVPPGDPKALATALEALGLDRVRRRRMAEWGRQHVEAHFNPETMGAAHYAVYIQLMS